MAAAVPPRDRAEGRAGAEVQEHFSCVAEPSARTEISTAMRDAVFAAAAGVELHRKPAEPARMWSEHVTGTVAKKVVCKACCCIVRCSHPHEPRGEHLVSVEKSKQVHLMSWVVVLNNTVLAKANERISLMPGESIKRTVAIR